VADAAELRHQLMVRETERICWFGHYLARKSERARVHTLA